MMKALYTSGQWLVYISLFLPLVLINTFLFPFITPRNFLFRLFMLLGLGVVTVLWLNYKQFRPTKQSWITWLVFGVVGAKVVSALFGVNFYNSFWSNYERMEGLVLWLLFVVLYALVITVFQTKQEWRRLLRLSLIPALIVAIYGLGQAWEWSFVSVARQSRIESLLGNAAYVGAYMVVHIGIAVYVWAKENNKIWKWIAGLSLIPLHLAMFYSATRGAILGWFVGLVIMAVLFIWWSENKKLKQQALTLLVGILVLVSALFALKDSAFVRDTEVLRRMTTITLSETTVKSRLEIWGIAFEGWKQKPIFGWGQENFNYIYNKFYNTGVGEVWVDRAHNNLLDQLSMGGIVTFLAYVALLLTPFYFLWQRRKEDSVGTIILIGLWSAYIIQNQFVFDSLNTYLLFFILLGLMSWRYHTGEQTETFALTGKEIHDKGFNAGLVSGLALLIIILISIVIWPGFIANRVAIEAFRNTRVAPEKSIDLFEQSLGYDSFGTKEIALQTQLLVSEIINRQDLGNDIKVRVVNMSLDALEQAQELEPDDVRLLITLGAMYQTARVLDPAYLDKAEKVFLHAKELGPGRLTIYFNLAQIYLTKENYAKAQQYVEEALEQDPKSKQANINLLQILMLRGDAANAYKQAVLFESMFKEYTVTEMNTLIESFRRSGDYERAENMLVKLIQVPEQRISALERLVEAYEAQGKTDLAEQAQQALDEARDSQTP